MPPAWATHEEGVTGPQPKVRPWALSEVEFPKTTVSTVCAGSGDIMPVATKVANAARRKLEIQRRVLLDTMVPGP
ncbi:hypothetical protein llg_44260 [Luteolibacter sp. LG18]|nr:hypothetical protein llg_44260 [Luteolibacter sp. LG18]